MKLGCGDRQLVKTKPVVVIEALTGAFNRMHTRREFLGESKHLWRGKRWSAPCGAGETAPDEAGTRHVLPLVGEHGKFWRTAIMVLLNSDLAMRETSTLWVWAIAASRGLMRRGAHPAEIPSRAARPNEAHTSE